MRRATQLVIFICLTIITTSAQAQTQASGNLSAQDVIARWRSAIHAREWTQPQTMFVVSTSNEDGIQSRIEEWLTIGEEYRRVVKREFDEAETVLTPRFTLRRDWNGFVRKVEGQELTRLRTTVFESQAIAFGPPSALSQAAISQSDDHQFYLLRANTPGGSTLTWYIDAKTWLPAKSVRPGEDTEITTTYEDWRARGGILRPRRARVSETDKPDYSWELVSVRAENGINAKNFPVPKPAPSDAHLDASAPPIPFNFENSHIMFKVSVNGREPIWFILDTGADQEVINTPRMAEFGLKAYARNASTGGGNSTEYDYAEGATFTLPGVEVRNQHVAAVDQTGIERALGMPLGGLLGYDFISRFVVEIDYQKQLITLHDPQTWTYRGNGYIVPLTFESGIPFMDGTISVPTKPSIPAHFVLDFGAAETMTLTSPFVKANDLTRLAQTNATINRPAGLENQFFAQNNVRGHIDQLTLGRMIVKSIPVNLSVNTKGAYASSSFSGTVGESTFRRYHVFLDYARSRVIFEPTPDADKPFPERRTYGLSLLASGSDLHTYTVAAVRPASPAEKDGFRKGDVIIALDNKPATQFTLGELRERLSHDSERHQLQIARGTETIMIPVEVRLISLDRQ